MTKIKLIALVVAIAVTFMGVGYSLWTQSIPITMSGSLGTFKVQVTGAKAVKADGGLEDEALASASHSSVSAVLTAAKLLPNGTRKYVVTFKNVGDANAVLKKVTLTPKAGDHALLSCVGIKIEEKDKVEMGAVRNVTLNQTINSGDSLTLTAVLSLAEDATLTDQEQAFEIELRPLFEQK